MNPPPNETTYTTYRKAVNQIQSKIKGADNRSVHIYAFNICPEQLKSAHDLLDKSEGRKAMRVTYSDDHNFIVRHMGGRVHEEARVYWTATCFTALVQLTLSPHPANPPGCRGIGATSFEFGLRMKQADSGIRPAQSRLPSIVLEVGDSESLMQLKIDARLWLEDMPEVQLVILLLISPPIAPHPTLPRIIIQLWWGYSPNNPPQSAAAQQRQARMVWEADWTHSATPFYILFSDIFRGLVPADYGDNDHVHLDTVAWRQSIIDSW
ncbi:hypothetical protein F5887DRAFT_1058236 [Amanita rubescens]|nr:hypothetical protein F5887DRAFT_1058236 [Amanita rubescens]